MKAKSKCFLTERKTNQKLREEGAERHEVVSRHEVAYSSLGKAADANLDMKGFIDDNDEHDADAPQARAQTSAW